MATLATETWTGTSGAWPAQWVTTGTTAISSNRGALTTSGAAYAPSVSAYLNGMTATRDIDVTVDVAFANIDEQYHYLLIRSAQPVAGAAPSNAYSLDFYPGNGVNSVGVSVFSGGNETALSGDLAAGQWVAGTAKRVRFQAIANLVQVKVWDPAGAEPGTWLYSTTNTVQSAATGKVAWIGAVGGPAAARTVYLTNLTVTDGVVGAAPTTVSPTSVSSSVSLGSPTMVQAGIVSPTSITTAQSLGAPSAGTAVPSLPNQVSGSLYYTTPLGTPVYKHEIQTDGVTSVASKVWVYVPQGKHAAPSTKMVFAAHGLGDTPSTFMEQGDHTTTIHTWAQLDRFMDNGYVVAVPQYESNAGNQESQNRLANTHTYLTAKWTSLGNMLYAFSMGGGISAVAVHRQTIPIKASMLVSPAINFADIVAYDSTLASTWYTAFNTNASGFPAASAAYDPARQPVAAWTGVRIRASSSPDDGYTILRPDATAFLNSIRGVATQAIDVQTSGGHGTASQFTNPDAVLSFFEASLVAVSVAPTSITSAASLGAPTITKVLTSIPTSILSAGALGAPTVTVTSTGIAVTPDPIGTVVRMGSPTVSLSLTLQITGPVSIPSASSVGAPSVIAQVLGGLRFSPPTVMRELPIVGALRAQLLFGVTLYRKGGVWFEDEMPFAEDLDGADLVYRGGSEYLIDSEAAAVLTAAGYGALIQGV